MKNHLISISLILLSILTVSAQADQNLIIDNIWIREAPPTVKVLAGYMTLKNPTEHAITLISAESPAFDHVMFHKTELVDGLAKMRHADEIIIPAYSSFDFAPGGYHLMLMGKNQALIEGDKVKLTLIFKNNPEQTVIAEVRKSIE